MRRSRRVRTLQVTEGILYSLLPSLMDTAANEYGVTGVIPPPACAEVASACLCVSCLLNAPPGFIEFLLCTPWHQMDLLYAGSDPKELLGAVKITSEQRKDVVNTPLPDYLLPVVLSFIYQPLCEISLPPMLLRTHNSLGDALPTPQPLPPLDAEQDAPQPLPVRTWPPMTWEVRFLFHCESS